MKISIIGAGLSGSTAAYLLSQKGHDVTVFERRNHIGGNCYDDYINNTLVHIYGSHIFHTNNETAYNFITQFTEIRKLKPIVYANTKKGLLTLPINKNTANRLKITEEDIIDIIFKDYSEKQWGEKYENLPNSIKNRVPKIREEGIHYFSDKYQGVPIDGYTKMFQKMLSGIDVKINCKEEDWKSFNSDLTIYSGCIDEYYNYKYGKLKYRSLYFIHNQGKKRKEHVLNECNTLPYTRTIDNSYWLETKTKETIITKEFPTEYNGNNIPYYPYPDNEHLKLYNKYADIPTNIIFIGRLGLYKYLDMDNAIIYTMNILKEKGLI